MYLYPALPPTKLESLGVGWSLRSPLVILMGGQGEEVPQRRNQGP